jgi:hypothetical protein
MSNRALATWATKKVGFVVGKMVISRLLRRIEEFFTIKKCFKNSKRKRKYLCPEVEKVTYHWFQTMQEQNANLTRDLIMLEHKDFIGEWRRYLELQNWFSLEGGWKDSRSIIKSVHIEDMVNLHLLTCLKELNEDEAD